jgi:hypothetical protein
MPENARAGAVAASASRHGSCAEAPDTIGDHLEPLSAKSIDGADVGGEGLWLGVFRMEAADAEEDDRPFG